MAPMLGRPRPTPAYLITSGLHVPFTGIRYMGFAALSSQMLSKQLGEILFWCAWSSALNLMHEVLLEDDRPYREVVVQV